MKSIFVCVMKVALLTMVFNNNYGGMLQAFALQFYLKKKGYDVTLINAQQKLPPVIKAPLTIVKRLVQRYVLRKNLEFIVPDWVCRRKVRRREFHTRAFINEYISPRTQEVFSNKGIEKVASGFDCYVVGSDQVWRPTMYPYIDSAFFGFLNNRDVKRFSYAASFGVDKWEYTEKQTEVFRKQISNFAGVSVREVSGVQLCKDFFQVKAEHVLDPTMLLSEGEYRSIIPEDLLENVKPEVFCYILDYTNEKTESAKLIASKLGLTTSHFFNEKESPNFVYPSVQSWLASFCNAKFVFTDSFHGCLFSIIFRKPFIVFGNATRGLDRFKSVLQMVSLEDRMVLSYQELRSLEIDRNLDWDKVLARLTPKIEFSKSFLMNAMRR